MLEGKLENYRANDNIKVIHDLRKIMHDRASKRAGIKRVSA